jgi:hypothetical protein
MVFGIWNRKLRACTDSLTQGSILPMGHFWEQLSSVYIVRQFRAKALINPLFPSILLIGQDATMLIPLARNIN